MFRASKMFIQRSKLIFTLAVSLWSLYKFEGKPTTCPLRRAGKLCTQWLPTFSRVCFRVLGSSRTCRKRRVAREVNPWKPDDCFSCSRCFVPPRVANWAAYWYSRVSRSSRRMRAWSVSGLTGIPMSATPDLYTRGIRQTIRVIIVYIHNRWWPS